MKLDLKPVVRAVLQQYELPLDGTHGVGHWARVWENGRRISEQTGANLQVVGLFAVLHDSRRVNESTDPNHGQRAAEFAVELRGRAFDTTDAEFELLYMACAGHTDERTHPDITIQTCWDADRLDLGRVGMAPHPTYLCTEVAKRKKIIQWADRRAGFRIVPEFVQREWKETTTGRSHVN